MDSELEAEIEKEIAASEELIKKNVVRPAKFELINMLHSDEFINKIVKKLRDRDERTHSEETGE